jgi:hypothetical protein
MDDKTLVLHMKQAELQTELISEAGQELDRAIQQFQEWSSDKDCQRRACEDIYDAVQLILIHSYHLSRIFWPAKCCGEQGLELCHRAMALRAEINLPDLQHPLRNEALWRYAEELDHTVRDKTLARPYYVHHLASFNQVITWLDNEAMLCWLEPNSKTFVFRDQSFDLLTLQEIGQQLQQDVQCYLKKQLQPNLGVPKAAVYFYEKHWAN